MIKGTYPVPLRGVVPLALPPLPPRSVGSTVPSIAASSCSVLQQLHHLTLVDGIDTLRTTRDKEN